MKDNVLEFPKNKKSSAPKKVKKVKKVEVTKSFPDILDAFFASPKMLESAVEHMQRMEGIYDTEFDGFDEFEDEHEALEFFAEKTLEETGEFELKIAESNALYREGLAKAFGVDITHIMNNEESMNDCDFIVLCKEGRVYMDVKLDEDGFSIIPKLAQFEITDKGLRDFITGELVTE